MDLMQNHFNKQMKHPTVMQPNIRELLSQYHGR